ncbi:MAG: hypothetical protein JRJ09_17885, partial [Deltaproteobacteria bacterium]|nr:hypothetical protein [Deltaproteobacteria bacterium]
AAGQSISELQPASWSLLAKGVAGHGALLVLSILGLGLLVRRHYRIISMLLFPILLALLSFVAQRFLIYLIPLYALGLAYLLRWLSGLKPLSKIPMRPRQLIMALLCLVLLGLNAKRAVKTTINPRITPEDVHLALTIREKTSPDTVIWTWWDSGYFMQFYTGRRAIIHGGNQNSDLIFITAFPLTVRDPVLARNWMKFFAARGLSGLYRVNSRFNDMEKTVDFLKQALARPDHLDAVIARFGLEKKTPWREYLFPGTRVCLYLPYRLIKDVYWWFYYGTWDLKEKRGVHPAAAVLPGEFSVDSRNGTVTIGPRTVPISELYYVTLTPELHTNGHKSYTRRSSRMGAIWIKEKNLAYLLDTRLVNSLFTRLVLLNPLSPPKGFKALRYIPLEGGVWKVE